jgi:RNase P/RNase MRP subunit p29
MSDVARIVLPPKREDTTRLPMPAAVGSSPTVVPPAFPVSSMTARLGGRPIFGTAPGGAVSDPVNESPFMQRTQPAEPVATPVVQSKPPEQPSLFADPPKVDPEAHKPAHPEPLAAKIDSDAHQPPPAPALPVVESRPELKSEVKSDPKPEPKPEPTPPLFPETPKVDAEAHKPVPSPSPTIEVKGETVGEARKADAEPASPTPTTLAPVPERREFHLTNGEHVSGAVLRETSDAIYVQHPTLGIITVPRNEIAKRLVEIILINGDRIVGDILAESADMLYVRHASLGMLSVPRAQRSTRVVEAILKDGDRILGEVLTETETFTVIKSATLGTVTIPHDKMAMLNRKIEQIEMKALPPAPAQLTDKS